MGGPRAVIAALLAIGCAPDPGRRAPENVLLVVLDDVGVDAVGTWGEHPDAAATPVLDALAEEGVLFRQAWAAPVCTPSRAMLMTGRHGHRTGVGVKIDPGDDFELPEGEVTLAEVVARARAGWRSFAVGKWHLAGAVPGVAYDAPARQGFHHDRVAIANLYLHSTAVTGATGYFEWERCVDGACALTDTYATTRQVDDALELLEGAPEPWLMYTAFNAAHSPYVAPPSGLDLEAVADDADGAALYRSVVRATDQELGRLLDGIDPEVLARTTIVVLGDNGTPGEVRAPPLDSERGKHTMFDGGVRVPLLVAGPRVEAPGTSCDALVSVVDVLPTLAEIARVSLDGLPFPLDGESLLPFLADPDRPGREWVFTSFLDQNGPPPWDAAQYAVRDRRFELVLDADGLEHLYDLSAEPDDGPDLLSDALSPDASAALEDLRDHLAEALSWPYDH